VVGQDPLVHREVAQVVVQVELELQIQFQV
jgi:hypothetical protein